MKSKVSPERPTGEVMIRRDVGDVKALFLLTPIGFTGVSMGEHRASRCQIRASTYPGPYWNEVRLGIFQLAKYPFQGSGFEAYTFAARLSVRKSFFCLQRRAK
jgi:hypothetical protein